MSNTKKQEKNVAIVNFLCNSIGKHNEDQMKGFVSVKAYYTLCGYYKVSCLEKYHR